MTLEDLLNRVLWDNPLAAWLVALAIALGSYGLFQLARAVASNRLSRLAQHTATDLDDFALQLLASTHALVLLIFALFFGSLRLDISREAAQIVRVVAVFALLAQVGLWITAVIDFWVRREQLKRDAAGPQTTTLHIVGLLFKVAAWVLVVLVALDNIPGVEITTLVASLGIGGLAVGLAVQSILSDIFASVSIALDKPFVIGDAITVDELAGTVEHIGLKSVRVRAVTGQLVVFSTSDLLSSRIHNYRQMERRLVVLRFGISYHTPREKAARVPAMMQEIIAGLDLVTFERSHFTGFGDSMLAFETVYHVNTPDYGVFMDRRQAIGLAMLQRFEEEGIAMPYPMQVVLLDPSPAVPTKERGEG